MSRLSHIVWKKQIIGLIVLAMVIVGLKLGFEWYEKTQKQQEIKIEFIKKEDKPIILTMFDPNDLDEEAWQNLGFRKLLVESIFQNSNLGSAMQYLMKNISGWRNLFYSLRNTIDLAKIINPIGEKLL